MIKILIGDDSRIVSMRDMRPMQAGYIVDEGSTYNNHLVMRTQTERHIEVMDLHDKNGFVGSDTDNYNVRLLAPGEVVKLELIGE